MTEKHLQTIEARFDRIIAQKMDAKLRAELDVLKPIWEGSPNYGMGAILEALRLCANKGVPLPLWLARAVHAELIRRAPKQALKHYRRWREVRTMRDLRPLKLETEKMRPGRSYSLFGAPYKEIDYEETFEWTAERLRKTSASGSTKAIRRSYGLVENDLPKSERYKRTYTKRSR